MHRSIKIDKPLMLIMKNIAINVHFSLIFHKSKNFTKPYQRKRL